MRIVHVVTKFDVGGAQSVVRDLALLQKNDGQVVTVLSGALGRAATDAQNGGVDVHLVPTLLHRPHLRTDRKCADDLTVLLKSLSADVVHCHSSKGGLVGRIAARRAGIPSVYTAHGWPFQPGASMRQRIPSAIGEWIGSRLGSLVVCVTQTDLRLSNRLRITLPEATICIPNGTGGPITLEPSGARVGDDFVLVMVARFAAPKRHDLVIEAIRLLPKTVRVLFVGGGDVFDEVKRMAVADESLSGRVEFLGESDPQLALTRAHAMVLMSDYEGLPISILEGMRAGLPIIASRLPGIAEAVQHRAQGLLVERSAQGLAGAVRELLDDRAQGGSLCKDLGLAAFSRWQYEFTSQTMHENYLKAYHSLSGS